MKTFQVPFVVHHHLRLSSWAYASSPLATHAASSPRLCFSFPSVFVYFFSLWRTLNGHSRDLVVPQLLTPHRLVLAIWIFVVFQSYPSLHQVLCGACRGRMHMITRAGPLPLSPHPGVTDNHHRHSLESEAPVIEIVVASPRQYVPLWTAQLERYRDQKLDK